MAELSRDILVLRNAIENITQILAGRGIRVTQRGARAYVESMPDGRPIRVNLPYIPENAGESLIAAIHGFLDHEVAHLLFSDFTARTKADAMGQRVSQLHNILEDSWIEKAMQKRFTGSAENLDNVGKFFLEKYTQPTLDEALAKGDMKQIIGVLMVPAVRAWAGQEVFQEFMSDKWELLMDLPERIGDDLINEIKNLKDSHTALDLAARIHKAMSDEGGGSGGEEESDGEGGKSKGDGSSKSKSKSKSKSSKSKSGEDSEGGSDGDESSEGDTGSSESGESEGGSKDSEADSDDGSGEDEDDADGAGKDDPADEDEESGESDAEDESGVEDDDDPAPEEEGDDAGESGEEEDESESEDEAGEEDEADDDELERDDVDAEDDDEDEDEESTSSTEGEGEDEAEDEDDDEAESDEEDDESSDGGDIHTQDGIPPEVLEALNPDDFDETVSKSLTEDASKDAMAADYLPFTKDFDKVETFKVDSGYQDRYLTDLDDQTASMVGPLQKHLERLMIAKSQSRWYPGLRRGRVHSASLYKLKTGDTRVFRKKELADSKEVVASLVCDCSGSMAGSSIRLAMVSAYALSTVLDRLGIKHEVSGFTTDGFGHMPPEMRDEMREESRRLGRRSIAVKPISVKTRGRIQFAIATGHIDHPEPANRDVAHRGARNL